MVDRRFHFWRDFLYERFTLEIRIRINWCIYEVFTFEGLKGFISEILKEVNLLTATLLGFSRSASNIVQRCYLRTTPHFCSECTFWRKKSWEMPSISIFFFQALLRGTFTQQASLTLIVLALERYLTSVHPLTFEGFCSTKVSMVAQLIRLLGKESHQKEKRTHLKNAILIWVFCSEKWCCLPNTSYCWKITWNVKCLIVYFFWPPNFNFCLRMHIRKGARFAR